MKNKKNIFKCNICNYTTIHKSDFNRHKLSTKHCKRTCLEKLYENEYKFSCVCGKRYKGRDGLWRHQQKCLCYQSKSDEYDKTKQNDDVELWKDMIKTLINQNTEWQSKYSELHKTLIEEGKEYRDTIANMQPQSTITNNINTHNTFNLQVFLNETCKDAMNIDEFIDSIQVSIEDLKHLGKNGYVQGISDLFIKNLEVLDVRKRPLHCSDIKRETIYIRDKNIWNKENDQKVRLTKVATDIARLNTIALQNKYQTNYPNCLTDFTSKEHEEYGKIAYEAFGGKIDIEKANKRLFRNIMKFVFINKNNIE